MLQIKKLRTSIVRALVIMLLTTGLVSCKTDDDPTAAKTKTFVLVHGAWQAPFVWQDVKNQLELKGQHVVVVELQAHGQDQSPVTSATLEAYTARVKEAVSGVNGKVILVGHSLGGAIITQVASQLPDKIEKLVYIAGFIPQNGKSILDLANTDAASLLGPALEFSQDMSTATISNASINVPQIFCQDGSAQQGASLVQNLRPEPVAPLGTPLHYDNSAYTTVDKYYIHTLQDHAISYTLQQSMVQQAHITKTFNIASGHSPFVSKPAEVVSILLALTN